MNYTSWEVIDMATADQMRSLVKAYVDHDDARFKTIVLQIAAHEAKLGHDTVARELKTQIDKLGKRVASIVQLTPQNPMLLLSLPKHDLSELIVPDEMSEKIQRILNEYRNRSKLHSYGLMNRRKILIEGQPGTGKTFTASVIASELSLPLYTVQMDKLVTKFMGETSAKLRQIFDSINTLTGVYFFDEFDAIGADRSLDNEVGEMRRILNSFLQFIDQDTSDSIIIAATNNQKLLDQALFRRFDDVLHYTLPSENEIRRLLKCKLINYDKHFKITKTLIHAADGLNHAEIVKICDDAIKASILSDQPLRAKQIAYLLQERKNIYSYKEA
jgi:ATPase